MFIPVSISYLIIVSRLVDRQNNFYLFLVAWNQLITLIIMNSNIYNNNNIQYRPSYARHYK